MGDSERTTELVNAAYDSAGASQEQFEKTLDSLKSKLNQLKDAWDQFTMGIANNELIKGAVDALTGLLNVINDIINGVSGGNGLVKTISSLGLAFGALKAGRGILGNSPVGGIIGRVKEVATGKKDDGKGKVNTNDVVDEKGVKKSITQKIGTAIGNGLKGVDEGKPKKILRDKLKDIFNISDALTEKEDIAKEFEKFGTDLFDFSKVNFSQENVDKLKEKLTDALNSVVNGEHDDEIPLSEQDNVSVAALQAIQDLDNVDTPSAILEISQQMQELSGVTLLTAKDFEGAADSISKTTGDFDTMATAAGVVGGVLTGLGGILSSMGLEDAGNAVQAAGTALMGLVPIFSIISAAATAMGVQIHMSLGVIGLILAAVAAAIALVAAGVEAAEKNSLEGRLKSAQETAEKAKEAASEAKQEYDNLLNAQSEYSKLQETLENLTKGTNEWKEALIEANNKVLELLTTYPELAQYIQQGKDGQLIVTDEGFEKQKDIIAEKVRDTSATSLSSTMISTGLEAQIDERNRKREFGINEAFADKLNQQLTPQDINELQYGPEYEDSAQGKLLLEKFAEIDEKSGSLASRLSELASEFGYTQQGITDLYGQYKEYNAALEKNKIQMEAQNKAYLSNIATNDEELSNNEFTGAITDVFSKRDITEAVQNELNNMQGSEYKNASLKQKFAEETGEARYQNGRLVNNEGHDVTDKYDDEYMKSKIAQTRVTEQITKSMKDTQKNFEQLKTKLGATSDAFKTVMRTVEGFGTKLTQADLDKIVGEKSGLGDNKRGYDLDPENLKNLNEDQVKEISKELFQDEDMTKFGFKNWEALRDALVIAGQAAADAAEKLKVFGEETGKAVEERTGQLQEKHDLSTTDVKGLYEAAERVIIAGGSYATFFDTLDQITSGMDQADAQQVIQVLSSIENFRSGDDVDNAISGLKQLGIEIDGTLVDSFKDAVNAINSVNFDTLEEKLKGLKEVADTVQGKIDKGEVTFTGAEKEQLEQAGVNTEDFVVTGIDEWTYIGEDENILLQQISGQINTIIGNMQSDLDKRIEAGEKIKAVEEGGGLEAQILEDVRNDTTTKKVDVNGSGELADIEKYSSEELATVAAAMGIGSYDELKNELPETIKSAILSADQEYYGPDGKILEENQGKKSDEINQGELAAIGSGQGILDKVIKPTEQYMPTKVGDKGLVTRTNIEDVKTANKVLDGYIKQIKGGEKAVRDHKKALKEQGSVLANNNLLIKANIKDTHDHEVAIDKLNKALSKNKENISASNTNLTSYNEGLENVAKAAQQVFGDHITEEFVQKHIDAFRQLAEGGEEAEAAFKRIGQAAAENLINSLGFSTQQADQLKAAILDIPDVEVGGTADFSDIFNKLITMGATAKQAAKIIESLGDYTLNWVYMGEDQQPIKVSGAASAKKGTFSYDSGAETGREYGQGGYIGLPKMRAIVTRSGASGTSPRSGGSGNGGRSGGGGKGGGGKSKTYDPTELEDNRNWKNPYDEVYNTIQDLNKALRERNNLEKEYDMLAQRSSTTVQQMNENLKKQRQAQTKKVEDQTHIKEVKEKQLKNSLSATYEVEKGKVKTFAQSFKDAKTDEIKAANKAIKKAKKTNKKINKKKKKSKSDKKTLKKNKKVINKAKSIKNSAKKMKNIELQEYAWYDEKTGTVQIDHKKLDALQKRDASQGQVVQEYIAYLEKISSELKEAEDQLKEYEYQNQQRASEAIDNAAELNASLREALVAKYQKNIDRLSDLNDVINESNDNILEGIQESVALERQIRDNTKKEDDIKDKEAKLAYLKRDTSGANDLAIKQLEKELSQDRENYGDTLVDQELDRLGKQNEEAAKAREKQIDLMTKQLEYWTDSGRIQKEVDTLTEAEATQLMSDYHRTQGKSEAEKIAFMRDFHKSWLEGHNSLDGASGSSLFGGNAYTYTDSKGNVYKNLQYNQETDTWSNGTNSFKASEFGSDVVVDNTAHTITEKQETTSNNGGNNAGANSNTTLEINASSAELKDVTTFYNGKTKYTGGQVGKYMIGLNSKRTAYYLASKLTKQSDGSYQAYEGAKYSLYRSNLVSLSPTNDKKKKNIYSDPALSKTQGTYTTGSTWGAVARVGNTVMLLKKAKTSNKMGFINAGDLKKKNKDNIQAFETGGVADFTGPAWLDGTKSKPELVLNAKDTQNFIQLKNILADLMKGNAKSSNTKNGGDNYYDFHITIDKMANDYDVDKMIQKVKEEIHKDSIYRNVNSIHLLR